MTRSKSYNKEKFLEGGLQVILDKGFNAASVSDIATASGAPKGSFYNYFQSKDHFFAELIIHHHSQELETLKTFANNLDGSPLFKLRMVVNKTIDRFFEESQTGCLVGEMCQIEAGRNIVCRKALDRSLSECLAFFEELIAEAQKSGELTTRINARIYAGSLQNSLQGAMIRASFYNSRHPFEESLAVLLPEKN